MPQSPPNNFTVKSGTITNGLLTMCLILGGVIYTQLVTDVKEFKTEIKDLKSDIAVLVSALNEKGLNIEVNRERLNAVEKRVEVLEKKVSYNYNPINYITLYKPEEEIKYKLKKIENEDT